MKLHQVIDTLLTHAVAWVLCVALASLFSCFTSTCTTNYALGTWFWAVYLTIAFMNFLFDHAK